MTNNSRGDCGAYNDGATLVSMNSYPGVTALLFQYMIHVDAHVLRNADAPWDAFSPHDYWRRNYLELQAEDQEIIRRVSHFFVAALAGQQRVRQGIDIGSGTNLYPALLMLPWAEKILLSDFSASNVRWLRRQLEYEGAKDDGATWTWHPFWQEARQAQGYSEIGAPRKQLREACANGPGLAGIEQRSVFDLPAARWDLGTMFFVAESMFFVAESITEDPVEFRSAIAGFVGALRPGAPFAATFMAGSAGYPVADTHFPALPVTRADVQEQFTALGAGGLSVELLSTKPRVRDGYQGMIVATGFADGH